MTVSGCIYISIFGPLYRLYMREHYTHGKGCVHLTYTIFPRIAYVRSIKPYKPRMYDAVGYVGRTITLASLHYALGSFGSDFSSSTHHSLVATHIKNGMRMDCMFRA